MGAGTAKDMKALGLSEDFTLGELKSVFRKRAKLCHPDVSASGGREFTRLREAYERLLSFAEKRDARQAQPGTRAKAGSRPEAVKTKPRPGKARPGRAASPGAGKESPKKSSAKRERTPDAHALMYYQDALLKFESFQAVNRDRAMELKFLYSLTKKHIALVDLHTFIRLLDKLEESARAALGLFRLALERDPGQAWASDARTKAESLERQLSRCMTLKSEVAGGL
jgi:hypothetical protein